MSTSPSEQPLLQRAYLAVGSNIGDRAENIIRGINILCNTSDIQLIRTSFLHQTAPMYVTDQPAFVNGVVEVQTQLQPIELLRRIKDTESQVGRDFTTMRNGPRTVDLDIVLYGQDLSTSLDSEELVIPHPRLSERDFVLGPLCEVGASEIVHPTLKCTIRDLLQQLHERSHGDSPPIRILPLPRGRALYFNETLIMGILNVTPDSFSDGGNYEGDAEIAAQQALQMERDGASIIDIGGESTRPGAKEVDTEEELRRTIPIIKMIRECKSWRASKLWPRLANVSPHSIRYSNLN